MDKDCRLDSYGLNLGIMDLVGRIGSLDFLMFLRVFSEEGFREWGIGFFFCVLGF